MKLNTSSNEDHFKSDSIEHGRLIKKFFYSLTNNVYKNSWKFYQEYQKLTGLSLLPLLQQERNIYSIFATAIDKITPIHISEYPFNKSDTNTDDSRRVDFWCLNKNGKTGKVINYFIEIKKSYYCLSENTVPDFTSSTKASLAGLIEQIKDINHIQPTWDGDGEVYLGMLIIHGYHNSKKEVGFDEQQVIDNVNDTLKSSLDSSLDAQLIMNTWHFPTGIDMQSDNKKCKFISIIGIAISTKNVE
jgi:hypothetical protein